VNWQLVHLFEKPHRLVMDHRRRVLGTHEAERGLLVESDEPLQRRLDGVIQMIRDRLGPIRAPGVDKSMVLVAAFAQPHGGVVFETVEPLDHPMAKREDDEFRLGLRAPT
jgi:hypothetical protein